MKNFRFVFFLLLWSCTFSRDGEQLLLNSDWKFIKGDSPSFANVNLDDSLWETILIDKNWESQNANDYDGIAWYRIKFVISSRLKKGFQNGTVVISAGVIDDNDEIYFNGDLIGANNVNISRPKARQDSINNGSSLGSVSRVYELDLFDPRINWDKENVIAIRVFDSGGEGGMKKGIPMIYVSNRRPGYVATLPLNSDWRFVAGDSMIFRNGDYDDSNWSKIKIDCDWERQGFVDLDGYGWFRKKFNMPKEVENRDASIKFNLGYIDDNDEVYFNGVLIGRNGYSIENESSIALDHNGSSSTVQRIYELKSTDDTILWGGENTIAVRVYDSGGEGGMTHGIPFVQFDFNPVIIDKARFYTFKGQHLSDTTLVLKNRSVIEVLKGEVEVLASDLYTGKTNLDISKAFTLNPRDSTEIKISLPFTTDKSQVLITIKNDKNDILQKEVVTLPFVLIR